MQLCAPDQHQLARARVREIAVLLTGRLDDPIDVYRG
jgi:hypothetical protein